MIGTSNPPHWSCAVVVRVNRDAGFVTWMGLAGLARARKRREGEYMMLDATPLIFPQLGPVYQALFPWAEALLRAVVGLTLVPHGLRSTFGMFPSTGAQSHNLTEFANELDRGGYHPGKFWARAIVLTQLVAGPMLALGLFTRLAALPIFVFLMVTNHERWRVGGFFWTSMGLEFTLMWSVAALYFLVHGGGAISVDHLLIGREF